MEGKLKSCLSIKRKADGNLPKVSPGRLTEPSEGSKNTSREDEAVSSNIEAKAGGSRGLPFAR